jgi:hypothetical protein
MPQCHHLPPLVAMLEKIVESKISVKDYVAQVKHKKQQH